ncbi:hypothetical protein AAJ76_800029636 [Vairimorpha ceranae]|uniref:SAM-dependent methyltransferase TRM5/TYW2-type domain-containing protein n=1 Tax=Vairimorpha ceranae TaxID=40302 RepID=A0A0F9YU26_9MICR|nr:hypothetical protein AAJ76_800029636 [Vairimorpha ceranae]KAF5140714.1 hypothetical protein G9O61_00g012100 [Vairimorpha ceranae]KKO75982.1 hypothetical protein AAJ76_800029636 [Vairimorpha ceranae]
MNLLNLIEKVVSFKCKQAAPSKSIKLSKVYRIPSIINLRKNYPTFRVEHNFSDLNTQILLCDSGEHEIVLILNYNFFHYSEIINTICDIPMPVSYETVGDVIHFNLNVEHLPYKYLIGKILYDKTGCTVINKLGNIKSTFRYYDFEYIGGKVDINSLNYNNEKEVNIDGTKYTIYKEEDIVDIKERECKNTCKSYTTLSKDDFNKELLDLLIKDYCNKKILIKMDKLETTLIQNDVKFFIDLKNVYWCSKLQEERRKLINEIDSKSVVCDAFCGAGPMVIPLLKKGCQVYCNDLNEKAINCLKINLKINKIEEGFNIENQDAKVFLKNIQNVKIDHYILNLPEYSIDYLKYINQGKVHCYFFSNENDVKNYVFVKTGIINPNIRLIRKVSPSKNVYKLFINLNK